MKPQTLKEALKGKLTPKELTLVIGGFDRAGDLIITEIPEELVKKEKLIGKTLLEMHPGVKTVAKKVGVRYGRYRRQKLKILAGRRKKTAEYKENGVRMYVNYEQAYFSSRLGNDRLRIARLVKPGETILVMFSGIGPYLLSLRKHSKAGALYGVELNPLGHKLAEQNVLLNKMKDIHLFCGDVRTVVPQLGVVFDRVLMPLPMTASDYLDVAFNAVRKGGVVHYYAFWHEDEFAKERKNLEELLTQLGIKATITDIVRCGVHKPRVDRVCVEMVKL